MSSQERVGSVRDDESFDSVRRSGVLMSMPPRLPRKDNFVKTTKGNTAVAQAYD